MRGASVLNGVNEFIWLILIYEEDVTG